MADTKDFEVINVARSDGQDTGPGYWPLPVEPPRALKKTTKEITEKAPRAKPQMARLAEDDPRFVEWRVKLGILLKQELAPSPDEGLPWYVQFPRGYWLYEKSKHLWVSGYPNKSKLFKSPQEFAIHLIWLVSTSKDYKDCCCIHCNIPRSGSEDELVVAEPVRPEAPPVITPVPVPKPAPAVRAPPAPAAKATKPPHGIQQTPVPVPIIPPSTISRPPVPISTVPPPATSRTPVPPPATSRTPVPPPIIPPFTAPLVAKPLVAAPLAIAPSPTTTLPTTSTFSVAPFPTAPLSVASLSIAPPSVAPHPAVSVERSLQPFPNSVSSNLFRTGELVWYQVAPSWRIGLITAQANKSHEILPISHGVFGRPTVPKADGEVRPYLAFTVPPISIPELSGKAFDDVPWDSFIHTFVTNEPQKREVLILDLSKMAALKIGQSYSLFSRLDGPDNSTKISYYGIFLGAERIEIGDTLRVRPSGQDIPNTDGQELFGLREIYITNDSPGSVFFRGDIYQQTTDDSATTPSVPEDRLPRALKEESMWRSKYVPSQRWRCLLLRENAVLGETEIKGRYYPSFRVLPILHPAPSQLPSELAKGYVKDVTRLLNQRTDTFKDGYVGRKTNRLDTAGPAVPHGSRFLFESVVREDSFNDGMLVAG